MVASTLEFAGVASSIVTVPEGCGNNPRTFENTCLHTNPTEEFSGSRTHFETAGTAGAAAFAAAGGGAVVASGDLAADMDSSAIRASTAWRMGASQDVSRFAAIFTRLCAEV